MHIKIIDNNVSLYDISNLYQDHPNVSFPIDIPEKLLNEYNIYSIQQSNVPDIDQNTQIAEEDVPVQINGVWTQQWVVRDLTPEELKARVPTIVTMRQARHALLNAGLLDAVDAAISAIPDETERRQAQIDWEYATEVRKDWPWVQTLSTALGLTEEQLDQLFIEASGL